MKTDDITALEAAMHTHKASKWTLLKVQLFGKTSKVVSVGCIVTMRTYKGKVYLTKCDKYA